MRAAIAALLAGLCAGAHAGAPLQRAAALYHQGRYDSALAELEAARAQPNLRRRDSLAAFQYAGMASARLGRADEAVGHFGGLLAMDSLFQFPRNEDPLVLSAFARARKERQDRALMPPAAAPAPPPDPPASPPPAIAAGFAFADSGTGRSASPKRPAIGLALGAVPLGAGWLARDRKKHGLSLGFLQAAGLGLSLYASGRISALRDDDFDFQEHELPAARKWQWVQGVSLSTALGAYLFSLIASTGD